MRRYNKRVALYASSVSNRGGTGVYTRRLIEGFSTAGITEVVPIGIDNGRFADKLLSEHIKMPRLVKKHGYDLVHLPAFAGNAPAGVPYAVTIHDMAFMAGHRWFPLLKSIYYRLHFPAVAAGASVIIADSDFTVAEIERFLGLSSVRVYLSAPENRASDIDFRQFYGIKGDYVLSAGTVEPRKNTGALLASWPSVTKIHKELTLVVAGRWGWGNRETKKALLGTPGVRWLGSVTDRLLSSAFAGAKLLVYPSLYEGFGLPPLEAAASGVPFVIGPAEALREIYSSVAAASADETPSSIAEAVLNGLENSLHPDDLREFAGSFTSKNMAENTYKAYGKAFE